ncbi:hypothetical protein [Burkholderia territorii]|uniref:hypothetical protein n=1 Tax=Burkholderia territorii TaxID=1503055 RepID=UPI000ACD6075|nr:hypothetical protein [Burkholderia territorii]
MSEHANSGFRLAWGAWLSSDDILRMRWELAGLIDQLADEERWSFERRARVRCNATHGPISDLMPSLNFYRERMAEIFAERDARRLIATSMQRRGAAR